MSTKAMIIVAAGQSSRFGAEKLLVDVAGLPLISHTVSLVREAVDTCVLVCRHDLIERVESLDLGVEVVPGGPTRTSSEMAGVAAIGPDHDLVGIHDGARPAVGRDLIDRLFENAARVGGAVPVLNPPMMFLDRTTQQPLSDVVAVQTPQVFRGLELRTAYSSAARNGVAGYDTVEIMHRFSDVQIAAVPGDPDNIKVTYPEDVKRVTETLTSRLRT